ncbi:MAG: alanine--tRNA ligase, partial [Clostridiales bacterium]|nr:alanine--tRNA ligase [Clostridiales bacterium]
GYVLRRILRRAARHGKLLGIKDLFLSRIAKTVINESKEAYPELKEKEEYILKVIEVEEKRFDETIDQGLAILKEYIKELKQGNNKVLDGQKAFKLYDTFGFPLDLTKEILEEEGLSVDEEEFNEQMKVQRDRARAARQETDYMGADDPIYKLLNPNEIAEFKGYETLETRSRILNIIKDNERIQTAHEGDQVLIVLDKTPFYAESGGQVGDIGILESDTAKVAIEDVSKVFGSHIVHKGKVVSGRISIDDEVDAKVDREARMATARNHSTTHLLHRALKEVLGSHVEQAGSLVTPSRLRFDFTHFAPLTSEEIEKIEKIVNEKIMEGLPVETIETTFDEAKKLGAIALFGEKYGDIVRVVKMGDFTTELCGGTHLANTGQAGLFKIISETGVAAGVRRIEAVTGVGAHQWLKELNELVHNISEVLKTTPNSLIQKAAGLVQQIKEYEQEIQQLKRQLAQGTIEDLVNSKKIVGDVSYIAARIDHQDMNSLREIADTLRNKLKSGVVVLASENQQKVNMVAAATKDLVSRGVHSGNLIREVAKVTGGGGGGRPDMAQAGGKDPSKISQGLEKVKVLLEQQLGMNK